MTSSNFAAELAWGSTSELSALLSVWILDGIWFRDGPSPELEVPKLSCSWLDRVEGDGAMLPLAAEDMADIDGRDNALMLALLALYDFRRLVCSFDE
jgi:hypothetical protein